jgi:peptidoglycan/LPS O-acetylase OafA/YrhL
MIEGRILSEKNFQLDSLDGLRGLAVLLVFMSHTSEEGIYLLPSLNLSGIGKGGVYLFFVLSAFLLTMNFLVKSEEIFTKDSLINYSFRRFFRIFPLYIVYLLLGVFTTIYIPKYFGSSELTGIPLWEGYEGFFRQLLLLDGQGVTWSILVEFHYYFLLPVVALIFALGFNKKLLPSLLMTVVLVIVSEYLWPANQSLVNDSRLGPYLPLFFVGSFLALLHVTWNKLTHRHNAQTRQHIEIAGVLALIAIVLLFPKVASILAGKPLPDAEFHRQFLLYAVLWSIVLFACIHGHGFIRRTFEQRLIRYFGFISFSFYLWHIAVITTFERFSNIFPFEGWVILIATIAISHISFIIFERPFSRLRFI